MTKIVDLQSFRERALEQKSFGPWQKRFGESFGAHTRISDLSDKTLFSLAQPGETSTTAFYELIMGALDLGPAAKFYYLANDEQMLGRTAIMGALTLYLDFINMFMFLLQFLGNRE